MPLGGDRDAVAVIARACRSRLFGYFFAVPSTHAPSHDELRALTAGGAIAALLFGGAPIEQVRWPVIATSLAFDPERWPFPDFAARGAFGESWARVRYDPDTMQIVERAAIDSAQAAALADARFAGAHEVEAHLRKRLAGEPASATQRICEVRAPLDRARLRAVENGGRIQFSTPLRSADVEHLAAFVREHPHVEVRVHGFRHGFDAASLAPLTALHALMLDVRALQHPQALRSLTQLRILRVGDVQTDLRFLDALPEIEQLELRGTRAALDPVLALRTLHSLVLENTAALDLSALASAPVLRTLILAHGSYDVQNVGALTQLHELELRALEIAALPDFSALPHLRRLHVDALKMVHDLSPILTAHSLRELRITRMAQLNVTDFHPLQACAGLQELELDVGSRSKEREIYRFIKGGNTVTL